MKSNLWSQERKHLVFFPPFLSHTFTSVSLVQDIFFFSPPLSWRDGKNVCKRSLSLSLKQSQSLSLPGAIIGMSSSAIKRKAAACSRMRAVPTASWVKDGQAGRSATKQEDGETGEACRKWKREAGGRLAHCASGAEVRSAEERKRPQPRSDVPALGANATPPCRATSPAVVTQTLPGITSCLAHTHTHTLRAGSPEDNWSSASNWSSRC